MDQIISAIEALYDPRVSNQVKTQANEYIETIKTSADGYKLSLELLVAEPKRAPYIRLFSLQTIDYLFNNRGSQLPLDQLVYIKDRLWNYLMTVYLPEKEEEPIYIRIKLATTFATMFRQLYLTTWPTFFSDWIPLLNGEFSIKATEFWLRILKAIDEEVVNVTVFRGKDDVKLNMDVKDRMREQDLTTLVPIWTQVILAYQTNLPEFSIMGLEVMGMFADWIDIQLVVTEPFMNSLFQLLSSSKESFPTPKLRVAACDCFVQILTKGMVVPDKIQLLDLLKVVQLLPQLILDEEEFVEHVARLTNKIGLEYFMIWKLVDKDSEAQLNAYAQLEKLVPYILKFLNSGVEEVFVNVFPIVNELLNLLKQQVNKYQRPLTELQNRLLTELLQAVLAKSKFPSDFAWEEVAEEEEEVQSGNVRKSLKGFFDAIAVLNRGVFDTLVHAVVTTTLTSQLSSESDWTELELALRVLHQYTQNSKTITYLLDPNQPNQLNHLGDMVLKMVESSVLNCTHPAITPTYFDNVVRYHQFFELRPHLLPMVLTQFLGSQGVAHPLTALRYRVGYLLLRFVKLQKVQLGRYVQEVVQALHAHHLLQLPPPPALEGGEVLTSLEVSSEEFEAQLHLFEVPSTLLGFAEHLDLAQKVEVVTMLLTPLIHGIQTSIQQVPSDLQEVPLSVVHLHHCIMAVGSVIKGLPERNKSNLTSTQPWVPLLKQCTEIILMALQRTGHFAIIRDSARFTFSRMLHTVGSEILPYLIHLINGLMTSCDTVELVDILPFLSQVAHTFSGEIYTIMDDLLQPTLEKTFQLLNKVPSGTDDMVLLINLRKVYVAFLASLFNAKLYGVLCSPKNQAVFANLMASLLHFCKDYDQVTVQKLAFNILTKMVETYLPNPTGWGEEEGGRLPSWDQFQLEFQQFTLQQILPITFEVPMRQTFDLQDGQSVMVLGEITNLQQAMYKHLGPTFFSYLDQHILTQLNCPQPNKLQLVQALTSMDNKNYKKFFQSFLVESKAWVPST